MFLLGDKTCSLPGVQLLSQTFSRKILFLYVGLDLLKIFSNTLSTSSFTVCQNLWFVLQFFVLSVVEFLFLPSKLWVERIFHFIQYKLRSLSVRKSQNLLYENRWHVLARLLKSSARCSRLGSSSVFLSVKTINNQTGMDPFKGSNASLYRVLPFLRQQPEISNLISIRSTIDKKDEIDFQNHKHYTMKLEQWFSSELIFTAGRAHHTDASFAPI